ncbi:MAG: hypothetical protein N2170_00010 [Bacteroidia bacterium]|nr:hypothetical protein [Bacteroidia bacterium]
MRWLVRLSLLCCTLGQAQEGPFGAYAAPPKGWQSLASGPILVWYPRGHEGLAREVALWATDAHREVTNLLEFFPQGKVIVRLHPSPYAWTQQPRWEPRGSLISPPSIAEVYPAPTRALTAGIVRSQVIAVVLHQLYFSDGVRLQNRSLLYMPDWFLWGFAFFWGEGWQGEDLARLQSPPEKAFLSLAERTAAPSPLYKSLYKAIWFYLYRTYGQRKVIDILYMTRLTRSVSEALSLTVNLSEEELTEKWRTFIQFLQEKQDPSEKYESLRKSVLSAAIHPSETSLAYATLQNGSILYYLEIEGSAYELPGRWSWPQSYYEPILPMAFSKKGQLSWVAYEMEGPVIWRWEPSERKYYRLSPGLRAIQSISWQDEKSLLLSALSDEGKVAAYTLTFPQGILRKIGELEGDILTPQFLHGEIWASWQPDTSQTRSLSVLWEPPQPVVYRGGKWEPLSFSAYYAIGGGWIEGDSVCISLSDATGYGWPWIFQRDTSFPSAWGIPGLHRWIGQTQDKAYFLYYRGGRLRLGSVALAFLQQPGAVFPSLFAAEVIQYRLQRKASHQGMYRIKVPSIPSKRDSVPTDTPRTQRQPFYLFDEEVSRPIRRRRPRPSSESLSDRPSSFSLPAIQPQGAIPYHWLLWDIQMEPILHPLMRLGWSIQATARDMHADHEWYFLWTPYVDLRSSELSLRYTRYRNRWQPTAELTKQSHFFPNRRYGRTLRNNTWYGKAGIRYVFSQQLYAELAMQGLQADRYDMQGTDDRDLSASAHWLGGSFQLRYANLLYRERLPWIGWKAHLRVEGYRAGATWGFPLVFFQAERFQPVGRLFVLHVRGISAGGGNRGRYFFLGGIPDWINYDFQNRSQVPTLGETGGYFLNQYISFPGFPYQARRGKNLLLGSITARIPLLAWRKDTVLPTRLLYGFEWQVGYFVGTTWTTGNPFSQKNPIDAEYIFRPPLVISVQTLKSPFLMSIGTGIRFYIMRLPIGLETYWPVEEGRIGSARLLVSFRKDL